MARIVEITPQGVSAMSLAEIRDELEARYVAQFGEDLSLSPQTPQGQILGVTAGMLAEVVEGIVEDVNANSVTNSGGTLLTQLGSLLDMRRVTATRSRVTATFTGVSGTGVLAGSRVRTTAGAIFETLADAVLSPSGVQVDMQALETGPVEAEAGTLTEIVTVTAGWETSTNAADAALGRDAQSDSDFRGVYRARTGRLSAGAQAAMEASVEEAGGERQRIVENATSVDTVEQEFPVFSHSVIVVARKGSDNDIRRAVDLRRGQGVGTMTAIFGGAPMNSELDNVANGTVVWNGVEFTGLDLRPANTGVEKAAALTALLAGGSPAADPRVTVRYIDDRYVAFYGWKPGEQPEFGDVSSSDVIEHFGLLPTLATASTGPFVRTRERALTVEITVARVSGFPADGLARIRDALIGVADGYTIGQQAWYNDFLSAAENIPGTRVSSLTVQHSGDDVSGEDIPLDTLWSLPTANLTVNIS